MSDTENNTNSEAAIEKINSQWSSEPDEKKTTSENADVLGAIDKRIINHLKIKT